MTSGKIRGAVVAAVFSFCSLFAIACGKDKPATTDETAEPAAVIDNGVDGANPPVHLGDLVDKVHDLDLVRDRHAQTAKVLQSPHAGEGARQILDPEGDIDEIEAEFIAHFHDTRGTGMSNSLAALEMGLGYVDSSIGAIGGQPATGAAKYSAGNTGNTGSEDLIAVLHEIQAETRTVAEANTGGRKIQSAALATTQHLGIAGGDHDRDAGQAYMFNYGITVDERGEK